NALYFENFWNAPADCPQEPYVLQGCDLTDIHSDCSCEPGGIQICVPTCNHDGVCNNQINPSPGWETPDNCPDDCPNPAFPPILVDFTDIPADVQQVPLGAPVPDSNFPVISGAPGNLFVEATSPAGAPVSFNLTANDPTEGKVPVLCAPASGSMFPIGKTTVACAATDSSGNRSTTSFSVRVTDVRVIPPANVD